MSRKIKKTDSHRDPARRSLRLNPQLLKIALVTAIALLPAQPREAMAACNLIPGTSKSFLGAAATANRPFAGPADWVQLDVSSECHASSPGFSLAGDDVVTIVFKPPAGTRNAVVIASDCNALTTRLQTCETALNGGTATCLEEGSSPFLQTDVVDARTLRFRIPNTDALLSPDFDRLTLTGPAAIAVTGSSIDLPCGLATSACAVQAGVAACVDQFVEDDGSCGIVPNRTFPHFTILPLATDYGAAVRGEDDIRVTVDTAGNVLASVDWSGVLVNSFAVPVARLVRGSSDVDAFEGGGTPVVIPARTFLASYSPEGGKLPPIFDPQSDPTAPSNVTLFGSVDAPTTVMRLARRGAMLQECNGGLSAGRPCNEDNECSGGSCEQASCRGGQNNGVVCTVDAECPGGECGPGLFDFSGRLFQGIGPILIPALTLEALDPVPLDGLTPTDSMLVAVAAEGIENSHFNDDLDATDDVVLLTDRETGAAVFIGSGGTPGRAVVRLSQAPFTFPALDADDDVVAFLEPEPLEGDCTLSSCDKNLDGDVFDSLLRVYRVAAGAAVEPLPGSNIATDVAPLVNGRSLAVSQQQVFFRVSESDGALQTTLLMSPTGVVTTGFFPVLSRDGRHVVFYTGAEAVVRDRDTDNNGIFDEPGGTATIVMSVDSDGIQRAGLTDGVSTTPDGRFVTFVSTACDLVPGDCVTTGDTNGVSDAFVHDRDFDEDGIFDEQTEAGAIRTVRVSVASDGSEGDGKVLGIHPVGISANGRFVAFHSLASNLVAGDTNDCCDPLGSGPWDQNCSDVFVHDRDFDEDGILDEQTELGAIRTVRVSVNSAGAESDCTDTSTQMLGLPGPQTSNPSLSADGRYIVFTSHATNLVDTDGDGQFDDDTNGTSDVFVHDRDSDGDQVFDEPGGTSTTRVTVTSNGDQNGGDSQSSGFAISANGRYVTYSTYQVLAPGGGTHNVYLHDRETGRTTVVTRGSNGESSHATITADGRYIGFTSAATTLVPGDTNGTHDVFVHDRLTQLTQRVSVQADGSETAGSDQNAANISADGRFVAFYSNGEDLAGPPDLNYDIFIRGIDTADAGEDTTGDGILDDTVLHVVDATGGPSPPTALCPATTVAVSAGMAALLRPEGAGQTTNAACGGSDSTLSGPDLNGDGDTDDEVVHLYSGGSVQNLRCAAAQLALSSSRIAALVSESHQDNTNLNGVNGDTDVADLVAHVRDTTAPAASTCGEWHNIGQAADVVDVSGDYVAFLTPEAAQGLSLNSGDGDTADRVLQVYDATSLPGQLANVGQAAEEFVLGPTLVAFRTREASQGVDLNGDADTDDDVLQVYDMENNTLVNSGQAVLPCMFEACDPRLPYHVLNDTAKFLTFECHQGNPANPNFVGCETGGTDLNGDGDANDIVLQTFNVRLAVAQAAPQMAGFSLGQSGFWPVTAHARTQFMAGGAVQAGPLTSLAAVTGGVCARTGDACATTGDCNGDSCFVPPGGCYELVASGCPCCAGATTCNQQCFGGSCFVRRSGLCANNADCNPNEICNEGGQSLQRIVGPIAKGSDGSDVLSGAGRCVETIGTSCASDDDCSVDQSCADGSCVRDHGVCRPGLGSSNNPDCPPGAACQPSLVVNAAADSDGDELPDLFDNCPLAPNILQADADGDFVGDVCDLTPTGSAGCPTAPSAQCSEDAMNILLFRDKEDPGNPPPGTGSRARLVFKWVRGTALLGGPVQQTDFGPGGSSAPGGDVHLCFYEDGNPSFSLTAPQSGPWSEIPGKGWKYINKAGNVSAEGIQKVVLRGNAAGKAAITVIAKGANVPVPSLPRDPTLVKGGPLNVAYEVQLHVDGQTACHGMSYDAGTVPEVHVDRFRGDGVTPVGLWKIRRTGP